MRIHAVILAAGEGRRLGGPKALFRFREATFLTHAARLLRRPRVERVVAVLGSDADRVRAGCGDPDLDLALNEHWASGMLSSVLAGLDHAEANGADAVLIHPVDHPVVSPATVDRVIAALQAGARIAVPTWENRRGHPAGFARETWPALRAAPADRGARAVLADHPDWVVHVPGDRGCVFGVNTPEDYARLKEDEEFGRREEGR
jgi:CTP:molybdopterin cytidylyltransferase MocA